MAKRVETPDTLRNVALTGHRSAGCTSLAESMLHLAGVVREVGRVDDGTTLLDHDPEARARHEGVMPGWAWFAWKDKTVFLTDTPGGDAFSWPREVATRGADLRVVVVSAPDGVEPGTEQRLRQAARDGAATLLVVTRIDRVPVEQAEEIVSGIGQTAAAVVGRTPIMLGCRGPDGWTHALADAAPPTARAQLGEDIALTDDLLLEAWVEAGRLEDGAARDGLARAVAKGRTLPVLACSAATGEGVRAVLDAIAALAPAPTGDAAEPVRLLRVGTTLGDDDAPVAVFRVQQGTLRPGTALVDPHGGTHRVARWYAIRGPRRAKARKLGPGAVLACWEDVGGELGEVLAQDGPVGQAWTTPPRMAWRHLSRGPDTTEPALTRHLARLRALDSALQYDAEGEGMRLSGPTPDAVDRAVWRLTQRWNLDISAGPPPIAYLERPSHGVQARGVHRVDGDEEVAEFGEVLLEVQPVDPDAPFSFEAACDEEDLPVRFHPSIGRGVRKALLRGPTAGYPVCGVRARCVGGEYDLFATEDGHVEAAGEAAMRAALDEAGTEVLEPWSELEVHAPPSDTGAVLSDLSARRARIVGLEMDGEETSILAECPDRELGALAVRLRAVTKGQGWFRRRMGHYRPVPQAMLSEVVAASPYREGDDLLPRVARGRRNARAGR